MNSVHTARRPLNRVETGIVIVTMSFILLSIAFAVHRHIRERARMEALTGVAFSLPPPYAEYTHDAFIMGGFTLSFYELGPETASEVLRNPRFLTSPLGQEGEPSPLFWHAGPLSDEDSSAIGKFIDYYRRTATTTAARVDLANGHGDFELFQKIVSDERVFRLCRTNMAPQSNNGFWSDIWLIDPTAGIMVIASAESV